MTLVFSNILVPHDGTEISDAALTKAYQIAKVFGSNLTLLFVIEDRSVLLDQLNPFVKEETQIERTENQIVNILRKGA
jgi:nucleotide-binding universal stress UspA family protein